MLTLFSKANGLQKCFAFMIINLLASLQETLELIPKNYSASKMWLNFDFKCVGGGYR